MSSVAMSSADVNVLPFNVRCLHQLLHDQRKVFLNVFFTHTTGHWPLPSTVVYASLLIYMRSDASGGAFIGVYEPTIEFYGTAEGAPVIRDNAGQGLV